MPYFMSNEIFNRIEKDPEVSSIGYYDIDGTFFYVWERRGINNYSYDLSSWIDQYVVRGKGKEIELNEYLERGL